MHVFVVRELFFFHFFDHVCFRFEQFVQHWPVYFVIVAQTKPVLRACIADERFLRAEQLRRQEHRVKPDLQRILQHVGDQPRQKRTAELQAGIGVNFNDVRTELIVDHEVQAEHLHAMQSSLRIQLSMACAENIDCQFVHLRENVSLKANVNVRVKLI